MNSSRPVPTGSGTSKPPTFDAYSHPAHRHITQRRPLAPSPIKSELTTPNRCRHFDHGRQTLVGHARDAHRKDRLWSGDQKISPSKPNVLRLFVGQAHLPSPLEGEGLGVRGRGCEDTSGYKSDEICILETNLDDIPGESSAIASNNYSLRRFGCFYDTDQMRNSGQA